METDVVGAAASSRAALGNDRTILEFALFALCHLLLAAVRSAPRGSLRQPVGSPTGSTSDRM